MHLDLGKEWLKCMRTERANGTQGNNVKANICYPHITYINMRLGPQHRCNTGMTEYWIYIVPNVCTVLYNLWGNHTVTIPYRRSV